MFARSQILILLSISLLAGSVQADGDELQPCKSDLTVVSDFGGLTMTVATLTIEMNPDLLVCVDSRGHNVDPAWTMTLGGKGLVDSETPVDKRGCKVPNDPVKAAEILKTRNLGKGDGSVTYRGTSCSVSPECNSYDVKAASDAQR